MNNYLVVDLEATCSDDNSVPKREMEIIEIGAVLVDGFTLEAVDEFQSFVRPIRHGQLTAFCTELTSIEQSDVDEAPGFKDVVKEMKGWMYGSDTFTFCSWGDYDHKQLVQDCDLHGIAYPMPGGHINLKRAFSAKQGIAKKLGMAGALAHVGIELTGTLHRGIDDARNIAKLLPWCVDT